jgi:hypothetical protein
LKVGGGITIRTTVHSTDTVSVIGCFLAPFAVDINGIIRLSNALTRVEERLSRVIEACYYNHGMASGDEQVAVEDRRMTIPHIHIPQHKDWMVTMWHFGMDASVEYTGEKFSATWEVGEHALIRAYSKEMVEAHRSIIRNRNIVRLERQEYPSKTIQDAIQEKLGKTLL